MSNEIDKSRGQHPISQQYENLIGNRDQLDEYQLEMMRVFARCGCRTYSNFSNAAPLGFMVVIHCIELPGFSPETTVGFGDIHLEEMKERKKGSVGQPLVWGLSSPSESVSSTPQDTFTSLENHEPNTILTDYQPELDYLRSKGCRVNCYVTSEGSSKIDIQLPGFNEEDPFDPDLILIATEDNRANEWHVLVKGNV